jgi:hypothetical protein
LSAVPCFTSRGRVGPPCSSQTRRDPIACRERAGPPCSSQPSRDPIASRGRVGAPCYSQPKRDPIVSRGRVWLVLAPCCSQPKWGHCATLQRDGRGFPAAALEKAAPSPSYQPDLPRTDFSYRAATAPASLSPYFT